MSESKERRPAGPAQITLIMRLIGGGYLIYLTFQMIPEMMVASGGRKLVQLLFMVVFFTVGVLLAVWSLKKLLRGEFIHPGESEDEAVRETKSDEKS